MGGYIAQQFSLTYPNKLKKLVIVTSRAKPSAGGAILNQTWQAMLANGIASELVIKNAMGIIFAHDFLADEKKFSNSSGGN